MSPTAETVAFALLLMLPCYVLGYVRGWNQRAKSGDTPNG